ncbi:hypothetical protein FHE66_04140 [Georgenia sp. 311]|uniref:hypothetical protein n=1 Tax=Georgenia sp. 311 TaxID=2585134 RepID=UPI001111CDF0|nr:hypothetical protein [Georgenia sp. 311]TNC19116.1 hypothetical protein FHE66_04140 [Georgenia sp. 311]
MRANGNIRGVKGDRGRGVVARKWVAPSTGGYSARSAPGEAVERPDVPPTNGASVSPPRRFDESAR